MIPRAAINETLGSRHVSPERGHFKAPPALWRGAAGLLLKADVEWPNWTDSQIAEAFEIGTLTVARLRKRCVLEGLEAALCQRPQAVRKPRALDGVGEARLVTLACGKAPEGCRQWTMPLLSDTLVELKIVDQISEETVRKTLQQTSSSLGVASKGPCGISSRAARRQGRVCLPEGRGAEGLSATV